MNAAHPFALEGDLTVFAAAALKERLLAALQQSATLTIDASEVSEVDGAGIQLLIATRKEAELKGKTVCLLNPSAVLLEALNMIDLRTEFCTAAPDPVECPA